MALFGEKYGEEVRTIRFGSSIELCGGTHISRTGNIGLFRIMTEGAIAAGVRRIEAVTALEAEKLVYLREDTFREVQTLLNNAPDLKIAVKKFIEQNEELKKQVEGFTQEMAERLKKHILEQDNVVNGVRLYSMQGKFAPEVVKDIAFGIRSQQSEKTAFVAATSHQDKPQLLVMLTDDLVAGGMDAGKMVREAAKHIQGGGGGQKHFATAGGKNIDGLSRALQELTSNF